MELHVECHAPRLCGGDPHAHRRHAPHLRLGRGIDAGDRAIHLIRFADQHAVHREPERARRFDRIDAGVDGTVADDDDRGGVLGVRRLGELVERIPERRRAGDERSSRIGAEPPGERRDGDAPVPRAPEPLDGVGGHARARDATRRRRQLHAARVVEQHDERASPAPGALEHRLREQPQQDRERRDAQRRQHAPHHPRQRWDREAVGPDPEHRERQGGEHEQDPGEIRSEMNGEVQARPKSGLT